MVRPVGPGRCFHGPWASPRLMTAALRRTRRHRASAGGMIPRFTGGADMARSIPLAGIQARFPSEWVLLEDPETSEMLEVRSGNVLWHSKDRDEVYRKG